MNRNRVFFMIFVILLGAVVSAAPTADTVEDDAETGWGVTPGNTTYLDFPFPTLDGGYTITRNSLTLTRDPVDDWSDSSTVGAPDTSNTDSFVNNGGMDDKLHNVATDFSITITGLSPNTEYGIALSIKGNTAQTDDCDFAWGSENDGGPVNVISGIGGLPDTVILSGTNFGSNDKLFAVPFYRATSKGDGSLVVWIGRAGQSFEELTRTQIDGILIGTEIIPKIAWAPNPKNGAANIPLSADLSWAAPYGADETWSYKVYIDTDSNPGDTTPYNVSDPNILNSAFGPMTLGDYWWRVDAIEPNALAPGGSDVHTGDVWTFTAGVPLPILVNPPDGTGSYGLELTLVWDSDDESVNSGLIQKHRIILKNITDGTEDSTERPAAQEDYYLGNADMWDIVFYNKEYTWQIIELGAGDQVLAEGPVWSFNTLYVLQCTNLTVPWDLTGDCKVTLLDFAQLAASWLECGWQLDGEAVPHPDKDPCNW